LLGHHLRILAAKVKHAYRKDTIVAIFAMVSFSFIIVIRGTGRTVRH